MTISPTNEILETEECYDIKTIKSSKTKEGYGILDEHIVDNHKSNVLQWETGTGKTQQILGQIEKNPDKRHVVVVPTMELARMHAERLNLKCYLSIDKVDDPDWKFENLVVCFPSLKNVRGNIDFLYIDEIEECIAEFQNPKLFNGDPQRSYQILKNRSQNVDKIFFLDANAGIPTKKLIGNFGLEKNTAWFTCSKKEKEWIDCGTTKKHKNYIIQRIREDKKLAIGVQSTTVGKDLEKIIRKHFPNKKVRFFHRKSEAKIRRDETYKYDVLIYSPMIGSGISIDHKNHYHEIHMITCKRVGSINQVKQMIARVRHPMTNNVYFSGNNDKMPNTCKLTEAYYEKKWATVTRESNLLNKQMKIEYSSDIDYDPEAQEFVSLVCTKMVNEVEKGFNWIATYIRQNMNPKRYTSVNIDKDVEEDFKIRKKKRPEEEAIDIVDALEIKRDDYNASHVCREQYRIRNTLGKECYARLTRAEKISVVKKDLKGTFSEKIRYFAFLNIYLNYEKGKDILGHMANEESQRTTSNFREYLNVKYEIINKIFTKLNIDINNPSKMMNRSLVNEAFLEMKEYSIQILETLDIPIPGKEPMRWLSSILKKFGLKLERGKKPKAQGNKNREYEYCVDSKSIANMKKYSNHMCKQIKSSYEHYFSKEEPFMSTTFFIENNEKVVDMNIGKNKQLQEELDKVLIQYIQRAGDPHDTYVSRSSLSSSFSPSSFSIDPFVWNRTAIKRRKEGKEISLIEQHIECNCVQSGNSLKFTNLANPRRCPRRYPIIMDNADDKPFLLSSSDTSDIDSMILLSALPKEYYSSLIPPEGYEFFDWDMKSAHATILASLSNDKNMMSWVEEDAHQSTGDLLFFSIDDPKIRRNYGKEVNSAMISGCSWYWLKWFADENSIQMSEDEAKRLHKAWWKRFPDALRFRLEHKKTIDTYIANKKSYKLKMNGRTMFDFDWRILDGQIQLKDWPETINKRRAKAEMSAFTALLRAHESMLLDVIVTKAETLGLKLAIPMYDGALFLKSKD